MRKASTVVALFCGALLVTASGCGGSEGNKTTDAVDLVGTGDAPGTEMGGTDVVEVGGLTPDGIGEDGSTGDGPAVEDVPLTSGRVSGVVRDANGLPIAGAIVMLLAEGGPEPVISPLATDEFGFFDSGKQPLGKVRLKAEADLHKTVLLSGLPPVADVSVTLSDGAGEVELVLPPAPVLAAERNGADAHLTWGPTDADGFHSYRVLRGRTEEVTALSGCVGILEDKPIAEMTDRNLPEGMEYYRVYVDMQTADGHFMTGSNVVSVEVPAAEAMPDKQAFVMLKTGLDKDLGMINTAYLVVAPTDISAEIGTGKKIAVTSPLLDGDTKTAVYIGKTMTKYKGNKSYYYGTPATFVGQTRKLDEWDTKYAVTAKEWASDKRVGSTVFDIDGAQTSFDFADPMPDSRIENVKLVRDSDGKLTVTWDMVEDGVPMAGGPGKYGWKYLVKIAYPGIYVSGTDPDFEAEKMWTNYDIFDKDLNIGFSRVCEVAANMPQDLKSIMVPDGVFAPGDTVHVLVYAISTKESYISPDSGIAGYGKAYMYWLFNYAVMVKVP